MSKRQNNANTIIELYEGWMSNPELFYAEAKTQKFLRTRIDEIIKHFQIATAYGTPFIAEDKFNLFFFAEYFRKKFYLKYDIEQKDFFQYDGSRGIWVRKTEEILLAEILAEMATVSDVWQDVRIQGRATIETVQKIMTLMKGVRDCAVPRWQQANNSILFANGIYNLNDKKMYEFEPKLLIRNRINTKYLAGAECPEFLKMLKRMLTREDQKMLQCYMGQCLYGKNITSKILLLRGRGGTGKSTILNLIKELIGVENVFELRLENLGERFETSFYLDKTLLVGNDVPSDFLKHKHVGHLKSLVGHDIIGVEKKNVKNTFYIEGNFNMIIVSNGALNIKIESDAEAWRRRIIIADCLPHPIVKPIPDYHRILLEREGTGIINWAIEGLERLLEQVKNGRAFPLTKKQAHRRDNLLCSSDSVGYYLERAMVVDVSAQAVDENTIIEQYYQFCNIKRWRPYWRTQLIPELRNKMLELYQKAPSYVHADKTYFYSGIRLREIEEIESM